MRFLFFRAKGRFYPQQGDEAGRIKNRMKNNRQSNILRFFVKITEAECLYQKRQEYCGVHEGEQKILKSKQRQPRKNIFFLPAGR